jgi:predicted component of type VI protein secretion system
MAFPSHALAPGELAAMRELERSGRPFVAYRDGSGDLRLRPLAGDRLTVGRAEANDVTLPWDREVSRAHAQLECVAGSWFLSDDMMSRNGCFVDGERVQGRVRLVDGATLRFGTTHVLFRAPEQFTDTTVTASAAAIVRVSDAERRVLVALCRPLLAPGTVATPPSNNEIAEALALSPAGVKTHLRALFDKLDVEALPQNRKRAALAQRAIEAGLVSARDVR